MFRLLCVLYVFCNLVLSACSENTEKEDITDASSTYDVIIDSGYEKVILTTQIDEKGKVVEADGLKMNIPEGAINTSATIEISEIKTDTPYKDNIAGKIYKIKNFPIEVFKPIEISLKMDTVEKNSSFIMLGETNFIQSLNTNTQTFTLLDGEVKGKEIKGKLPYAESTNLKVMRNAFGTLGHSDKETILVAPITNMISHEFEHFKFIYSPDKLVDNFGIKIEKLNTFLEEAYSVLENDLGLSFSKRKRFPIKIEIKDFKNIERWALAISSKVSRDYDWIDINEENFSSTDSDIEYKASVGHELFHLLQDLYDSSWFIGFTGGKHIWFKEASSVWFEKYFLKNPKYCSNVFTNLSGSFILNGFFNPEDESQHGYGASLFLGYLLKYYDDNPKIVGKIWENILKKQAIQDAIQNATDDIHWYWKWESFINEYFLDNGYFTDIKDCISNAKELILNNSKYWYIDNPETNNSNLFTSEFNSLSAKPFIIMLRLREKGFEQNIPYKLHLSVENLSEESSVIVIDEGSKKLIGEINNNNKEAIIDKIETYSKGARFLLVIINGEKNKKTISVKAELKKDIGTKMYEWSKQYKFYSGQIFATIYSRVSSTNSFVVQESTADEDIRYITIIEPIKSNDTSKYIKFEIELLKLERNEEIDWDPSYGPACLLEACLSSWDETIKECGAKISKLLNPPITVDSIYYKIKSGLINNNTNSCDCIVEGCSGEILFKFEIVNK